ncbi:TraR/DksA family transcriptional regulator [Sphingobium sp. JS3065]|uniref:TraR/DksA family transcriptional regulator n=1 Tax=Sphingobium sp. JS3065 TaxID=2970925 RepID=UPI0022645B1D|nr:TraR/DksA C4-type zinc finger protein [Sphingobium sp. JS3065]UZW55675.1 TraR/DksA family transcriptional regulator [Sphingobium sp. JS3065]
MKNHEPLIVALNSRLRELINRADIIEDELRHPLDADSSEQAIDLADDETLAALDAGFKEEVAQIQAALSRIENGTYGTCTKCGVSIDPKRLEALPTAAMCINCA